MSEDRFSPYFTKVKVTFFLTVFFYIVGLFVYALSEFRTSDPMPQVKMISMDMRKENIDFSSIVRAGLFINNFPEFNLIKNHCVVDAIVWFEYNKDELMASTIDNFSFENSDMLEKSKPKIRRYGDKVLVKYDVKFSVKTDIDFHRFPLSDHRLSMVLKNDQVTAEDMYFDDGEYALSFKIDDDVFISDWKVRSLAKISGYEPLLIDENEVRRIINVPKVVFSIDFAKAGMNKILLILVPIFAAMFLSLFTFLMSYNSYMGKYSLSITSITALLGYRFVIHQMSPSVGYFTIADKLFIFFLGVCFFNFAFQVVMTRQYMFLLERGRVTEAETALADIMYMTPKKTEAIGSYVFYFVATTLAVVVTIFVLG